MTGAFDRLANAAAGRILAWSGRHAEPSRGPWVEAVRGEIDLVEGGPARLLWALGALSVVCSTRRSTLTRIWRSLPSPVRFSLFGLALGAVSIVLIVWSNVIVPSHESDSEYTTWYLVGYLGLFAYFAASGLLAALWGSSIRGAALTGAVTAAVGVGIILITFIVIDNLFLDVVMQQPDKASGFAASGLSSRRDYVNQGNLTGLVTVIPFTAALGAGLGTIGGLVAQSLRRMIPA